MSKIVALCLIVVSALCLPSCGYRFSQYNRILSSYQTVSVPFAEGDRQGLFTAILIERLTAKGGLSVCTCGGELALQVCLDIPYTENIGYTLAPNSKIVVANEGRMEMSAKIQLVDSQTGECVLGPLAITVFIDYDFQSDLTNANDHTLSLGQLEMNPLAKDAVTPALYNKLAQRIVDAIACAA